MKRIKIAQTLSAALTLHTSAGLAAEIKVKSLSETAPTIAPFQPPGAATGTSDVIKTEAAISLSHPETAFSVRFNPPEDWHKEDTVDRYRKLAIKEASSRLTKAEKTELDFLEELRDREETVLTGAQIIEQYKHEKTGLEMLRVLKTYVRTEEKK